MERVEVDMTNPVQAAFCPLDVPPEIWEAVAQEYTGAWFPAPNYHAEYRDCRNTYLATLRYMTIGPEAMRGVKYDNRPT